MMTKPEQGVSRCRLRTLHDTGRSGFWIFISFVPLVGGIILLVFTLLEGTRRDNAYGPDPKAVPQHA